MYCKFQRWTGTSWADYGDVTQPLRIADTLTDNTTLASSITIYLKGDNYSLEVLPPGEIVRLNFNTKIWYFVVIDSGEIDPHTLTQYKYHSYTVQELLCYFRETYVQTAFFTNGRYTLDAFLERLIALSNCDYGIDISTADAYTTMLANWNSPDYQVASNALLDNLIKIGKSLQVRLKARINASNNIEIYAKKLKGNTILSTLNGRKLSTVPQYKGANYAAKVVANVSNMANNQMSWWPSRDPLAGVYAEPQNDDTMTIAEDNISINLPFNILNATKVKVAGLGKLLPVFSTPNNFQWYDRFGVAIPPHSTELPMYEYAAGELNDTGATTEFLIVEYRKWLLLDPDSTGGATQHQENTLYFKSNENKIYNIKICNGAGTSSNTEISYYYDNMGLVEVRQSMLPPKNRYIIYGSFTTNGIVEKSNISNSKRTTIYSQDSNLVSSDTLSMNMQDHIDSMQNQDLQESWEFESIDDVPEVGNIYNGMVISEIQLTIDNKINAVIQLSDELVPKSEYVSADGGLNLPAIPLDKTFDRSTIYHEKLWFCESQAEASSLVTLFGTGEYINQTFIEKFLNSLKPNRNERSFSPKEIRFETGELESDVVYSAIIPLSYATRNSFISSFKTLNNVTVGLLRVFGASDPYDYSYYPVAFINEDGMSEKIKIKAGLTSQRLVESNYPAIGSQTMNLSDYLFQIIDLKYFHDPTEIVNVSYQIDYVTFSKNNYIDSYFVEVSGSLYESYFDSETRAVYINGTYYTIQSFAFTSISDGIKKITITVQGTFTPIDNTNIIFRIGTHNVLSMTLDVVEVDSNHRKIEFYIAYTKA